VWQDRLPAREDDDGIPVRRLKQVRTVAPIIRGPARRRHQPPFPDPVTVLELRRLIGRFRPEVLHAAGWFSYSCAAALVGRDLPFVVTARDYGFSCARTTLMHGDALCSGPGVSKCMACAAGYYGVPRGWLAAAGVLGFRPLIRSRATLLHSVSQYVDMVLRRDLMDGAPTRTPLEVVPPFRIEDDPPHGGDDELLRALPERPFVLFVGALRPVKGIETLLAAYRRLAEPPPLVLLGTRETDTPRDLPPDVVVIEELPNWAVLAAWDRSLFGVLPSRWPEPFGSVVHEAMSRGRAVIGTVPGGHADMIEDGRSGLLVSPGDVAELAAALRALVSDESRRRALGLAARQTACDRFDLRDSVERYRALFAELSPARVRPAPRPRVESG
jgi:glycosyltransferase involved in cell wall biosynthesis